MSLLRPRAVDRRGTSPPPVIDLVPALPAPSSIPLTIKPEPAPATAVALQADAAGRYWCPWCGQDALTGRYHTAAYGCETDRGPLTPSNTTPQEAPMLVKVIPNDNGNPPGKLADAELHFTDGPLEGLKLIGFGVWERRSGTGHNVTFPARQYSVNGERRSFALLRPVLDPAAQDRIRDLVLAAYAEHEHSQP